MSSTRSLQAVMFILALFGVSSAFCEEVQSSLFLPGEKWFVVHEEIPGQVPQAGGILWRYGAGAKTLERCDCDL